MARAPAEVEWRSPCEPLKRPLLTSREAEVLELLAEGLSTQGMAHGLYVSRQAVTYHVGNLLAKFQCSNRAGLVARAFVLGILVPVWPPRIAVETSERLVAVQTQTSRER